MKDFFLTIWIYLRRALIIVMLHALIMFAGILAMMIENTFWCVFVCVLVITVFLAAIFPFAMWSGNADHGRLIKRLNQTVSKPPKARRAQEYAHYRGFITGGIYSAVLVIIIVIAAIILAANPSDQLRTAMQSTVGILEIAFFGIFRAVKGVMVDNIVDGEVVGQITEVVLSAKDVVWFLIPAILPAIVYGAAYIFGGERAKKRHERFIAHKRRTEDKRK